MARQQIGTVIVPDLDYITSMLFMPNGFSVSRDRPRRWIPHTAGQQPRAKRQQALEANLYGKAFGRTGEVARDQFVELERLGEDLIWTVLGEFNDFPHNNIAVPDRSVDNTTIWTPDFGREHYLNLLFSEAPGAVSMRNYYIEQFSNRYTVNGDVTDLVSVPGDAASYDDDLGAGVVWQFLEDSLIGWYAVQMADGKTPAEIDTYLSQFDVWDRYDWDGDGNFDELDGYIDRFQSVHAGEGEEAGGGAALHRVPPLLSAIPFPSLCKFSPGTSADF